MPIFETDGDVNISQAELGDDDFRPSLGKQKELRGRIQFSPGESRVAVEIAIKESSPSAGSSNP